MGLFVYYFQAFLLSNLILLQFYVKIYPLKSSGIQTRDCEPPPLTSTTRSKCYKQDLV